MDAAAMDNNNLPATEELSALPLPPWYCRNTGIYTSTHPPRELPQDPFLDIVSFVFSHVHAHHHHTALIDSRSGSSLSYAELRRTVCSFSDNLRRDLGFGKGHFVLISLPNSVFYPVILLAVLHSGAVAVPVNPLSSLEEIQELVKSFRRRGRRLCWGFAAHSNVSRFDGLGLRIILVPEMGSPGDGKDDIFNRLLREDGDGGVWRRPVIRQSDTAAVLFSSGTTGGSKKVVLTHANLISMVELFVRFEESQYEPSPSTSGKGQRRRVYLAAVPMYHVYGMSLFAVGMFAVGAAAVVMRRFDAREALRAVERFRITHVPSVPPMLAALLRTTVAAEGTYDTSSLEQISCGAALVRENLVRDCLHVFPHVDFIQGYGMTESTAVGTRGFNTEKMKNYASAGLLAPNMLAKVVDHRTGIALPPGRTGELWLQGPAIMKGYLDDEVNTASAINKDGWLRTGDIVRIDQDGYLYILDRLKDTIKYKGFQVSPADLEVVLLTHPEVVDVAVTAAEDEEAGEIPVAFIVRAKGSNLSADQVIQHVAKQVAPYKKVRKVIFVNSLPRSPAGKVLRRVLRNSYMDSRL